LPVMVGLCYTCEMLPMFLALFGALIAQVVAAGGATVPKLTRQEELDSYSIYSMLLKMEEWHEHSPVVGIQADTQIFQPAGTGSGCVPEPSAAKRLLYRPIIEDFQRRNARPSVLEMKFDFPSYRLLTALEVKEFSETHGPVPPPPPQPGAPEEPTEENPRLRLVDVVVFLSAVGFSADHRRALVHIAVSSGGRYYFLVRRHSKWTIDNDYRGTICNWVF